MVFAALQYRALLVAVCFFAMGSIADGAEAGLVTTASHYSVRETVQRFVAGVKAKESSGWMVFTEIDHAAAAARYGLALRPRIVIIFGNPKLGTTPMVRTPALAIDVPLKALVWQDDRGKVWLTYNSGEYLRAYVYPRHGIAMPAHVAEGIDATLARFADHATR